MKAHPSRGGNAYAPEMCEQVIRCHLLIQPITTPKITQLRENRAYPSISTCKHWINQHNQLGHSRPTKPKWHTGNFYSLREVQGEELIQLALFWSVCPKSTLDECRAYLHNIYPHIKPYSRSQVYGAEALLGLLRKAASTTADAAYLPINLHRRDMYWDYHFP